METIQETHCYRISWHDSARSILLFEVIDQWNWTDANVGIRNLNKVIAETSTAIYSVYLFAPGVSFVPKGGGALANIRSLVELDNDNEQLVIFVGVQSFLKTLIYLAGQLGDTRGLFAKYQFVPSFEDAFSLIERHKKDHNRH